MVLDIEPVAHVGAVAVDGQRLAVQRRQDHQRDQLFRKMIGSVVVRAVRDHDGKAVGPVPGLGEMVGGRLGRGIGRAGVVGGGLGEVAVRPQRSVHLVGRDVHHAEGLGRVRLEPGEIGARRLEQGERPDDIGVEEDVRARNRPVHVALRREVDDPVRPMLGEDPGHGPGVADVHLFEAVQGTVCNRGQRLQIGRVGELVDHDGLVSEIQHEVAANRRPDEAGPAGDQDSHTPSPADASVRPVHANAAGASANRGCRRSFSERISSDASSRQSIPSAGSSHAIPRSHSGA